MSKVANRNCVLADLPCDLSYFLVRSFQEFFQNTQFMHDLESGRMNSVAAEITQEVGMLFKHKYVHADARKQQSQHHAGGTASGNTTASVNHVVHVNDEVAAFRKGNISNLSSVL
jgi:hypothetical protein